MKSFAAFTWIEILISLCVLIILASASLISYDELAIQNALKAAEDQLSHAILYARTQALMNHVELSLCGSRNQILCDGDWQAGQIVRSEKNILRIFSPLSSRLRIVWKNSFHQNNTIDFDEDGTTKAQQGHFEIMNRKKEILAKIIITHSGRLRIEN